LFVEIKILTIILLICSRRLNKWMTAEIPGPGLRVLSLGSLDLPWSVYCEHCSQEFKNKELGGVSKKKLSPICSAAQNNKARPLLWLLFGAQHLKENTVPVDCVSGTSRCSARRNEQGLECAPGLQKNCQGSSGPTSSTKGRL
jgi:hypothetical protein